MSEEIDALAYITGYLEGLTERLNQIDLKLAKIEADVEISKDAVARLETGVIELKLDMVVLKGDVSALKTDMASVVDHNQQWSKV